jgi:hypothetical protein
MSSSTSTRGRGLGLAERAATPRRCREWVRDSKPRWPGRTARLLTTTMLLFGVAVAVSCFAAPSSATPTDTGLCTQPGISGGMGVNGTDTVTYSFTVNLGNDGSSESAELGNYPVGSAHFICPANVQIEALDGTTVTVPTPDSVDASTSRAVRFSASDVCREPKVQHEVGVAAAQRSTYCTVEVISLRAIDPATPAAAAYGQCLQISDFARLKATTATATRESLSGILTLKRLPPIAAGIAPDTVSVVLRLKKPTGNGTPDLGWPSGLNYQSTFVTPGPVQHDCNT